MSFQLLECEDADMHRIFAIFSDAFGHRHPFMEAVFPDHDSTTGRRTGGDRMLAAKQQDPNARFAKVVYSQTDQIVGQAKVNVYQDRVPEEHDLDGDYWKTSEDKEIAKYLYRKFVESRRRAIRETGGNLVSLDMLAVDPQWQRKGVGRMLVQWATSIADELGLKIVVEASHEAQRLYQSEGFKVEEHKVIEYPEKWSHLSKQEIVWMTRPVSKT